TGGTYSKFPDIEFTPAGVPVVVWEDDRSGGFNVYVAARDSAATLNPWARNIRVNTTGGAPSTYDFMDASVAVLDENRWFVAWTDWREGVYNQVYMRATPN